MIIDELIALLGFETKGEENLRRFKDGMDRAQKSFESFANRVNDISRKITLGLVAIGTAAGAALMGAFKFASSQAGELARLGDVSDRLGVNVERLQELRHAATMGGMGVNNFDVAMRRFIRRSSEAAKGTGAAKDAFKELGISLKDGQGNLKNSDSLLHEVADAMTKVKDPADRLRLAFKMFDTDGAAMVKVLAEGSEGLRKWEEDARSRGLVFSKEEIETASKFNDELGLFHKMIGSLRTSIALDMMPMLTRFLRGMSDWYRANQAIIRQRFHAVVGNAMQALEWLWKDVAPRLMDAARSIDGALRGMVKSVTGVDMAPWSALGAGALLLLRRFSPLAFWATMAAFAIDELATYMKGGETVIGPFFDAISSGWDSIKGYTPDFFREWVDALDPLTAALTALTGLMFLGPALKIAAGLFAIANGLSAAVAAMGGLAVLAKLTGFLWVLSAVARQWEELTAIWSSADGVLSRIDQTVKAIVSTLVDDIGNLFGIENLSAKIDELEQALFSGLANISLYDVGASIGSTLFEGMKSIGAAIRDWFASLVPEWAKKWVIEAPKAQPSHREAERESMAALERYRREQGEDDPADDTPFTPMDILRGIDKRLTEAFPGLRVNLDEPSGKAARPSHRSAEDASMAALAAQRRAQSVDEAEEEPGLGFWGTIKAIDKALADRSGLQANVRKQPDTPPNNFDRMLAGMQQMLDKVTGDQAIEQTVNQVANDNRVTNVEVNAPVSISATTNATADQIGASAGNAVRAAGRDAGRSLAVTGSSGGGGPR